MVRSPRLLIATCSCSSFKAIRVSAKRFVVFRIGQFATFIRVHNHDTIVAEFNRNEFILQRSTVEEDGVVLLAHPYSELVHDAGIHTDKVISTRFPTFTRLSVSMSRVYTLRVMTPTSSSNEADDERPEPFGMFP